MPRVNSANFNAGYAARTSPYWHMAVPRLCDFSKASGVSPGMSVCGWDPWFSRARHQWKASNWGWVGATKAENFSCPLVVRHREYPFGENLFPDSSANVDLQLPLLVKVSSFFAVLQLSGSYELLKCFWERFFFTASRVSVTVAWSPNEVLVDAAFLPEPWVHTWSHF